MRTCPSVRRHVIDWVPTLVLVGVGGHELLYDHAPAWQWITAALITLALPLRRRFPVGVLVATLALVLVEWVDGVLLVADLGVLVALHAVAWKRPRQVALVATAVVEAAVVWAAFRFGPTGSVNDAVVLLTGLTLSAVFLGTTQRAQERYLVVLQEQADQLRRERNQRAEMAAVEERTRIAREIHDVVAHTVSVMIALSEGAARAPDDAASRASMRQVAATGRQALTELRRVLSVLRTDETDSRQRSPQPGIDDLPMLLRDVELAGLPVELAIDRAGAGEVGRLPDGLQATVYRVVQESLTNALKHADSARRAWVEVSVGAEVVTVVVRDDGRENRPGQGAGNGIRGMEERARLYGGLVTAGPATDRSDTAAASRVDLAQATGWVVHCVLERPR